MTTILGCECDEPNGIHESWCPAVAGGRKPRNPSSEAGLLRDFDMIIGSLPNVRGHEGSCGPEAGCDAACADAAFLSEAISRVRAALAKEARDADFGSPKEIIAGLDHINAHNGSLGKLCFSIAALEPFQPNISPSYRDGYTAAKNAALALVEAANEAARDAAKEPK